MEKKIIKRFNKRKQWKAETQERKEELRFEEERNEMREKIWRERKRLEKGEHTGGVEVEPWVFGVGEEGKGEAKAAVYVYIRAIFILVNFVCAPKFLSYF